MKGTFHGLDGLSQCPRQPDDMTSGEEDFDFHLHCNLCLMVYSIFHDALILYKFQNCYFALLALLHGSITMCDSQVIVFYSCTLFILLQVLHNCYILFAMAHMALHQSKIIAD